MRSLGPDVTERWNGGYQFRPFKVHSTSREFRWSRRPGTGDAVSTILASNISAVYTSKVQETLIGGVLQGRKQFDIRGASKVCRRSLWKTLVDVASVLTVPLVLGALQSKHYGEIKRHGLLNDRERVKEDVQNIALRGWSKNKGDEGFVLVND
jgi:tRNA-specific adenosine deaminase 1